MALRKPTQEELNNPNIVYVDPKGNRYTKFPEGYSIVDDEQNIQLPELVVTKRINKLSEKDTEQNINRKIEIHKADEQARRKTPGAGTFVVTPVITTLAGIGGATVLPYLLPGTIGGNIIGTTAFGEALNHTIKHGTGKTIGEHSVNAAHYLGIPQNKWTDFGIQLIGDTPAYLTGDLIGKTVVNAGKTLGREALQQMALNKSYFPTTKDLADAINTEVKNKQFTNLFPGQIGWAPRQTLTGYHASNKPIQEFNYWYPNWAVIEHDAPHGIYFTANETRPFSGFLAKRPYIEQVTSTFDKPMVQVGEIPASAKNATRNSIERQAQSMGADGIIYQGIKDNQLENQTIVKTLNPDQKVNVSEIVGDNPRVKLQGAEPEYKYNPKTGEFDITFPRGLRRKWATDAREDVISYFDSDFEYNRLINSGATPEQALKIMSVRGANAENALPIAFRNLRKNVYGDSQNIDGQAFIRLNQIPHSKASLINPETL